MPGLWFLMLGLNLIIKMPTINLWIMSNLMQSYSSYQYYELKFPASFLYYMKPFTFYVSYD